MPAFHAADVFRPSVLPPGFRFACDAPGYAPGGSATAQWSPSASSLFVEQGADPSADRRLWLVEEYGRHWPDGWPTDPPLVGADGSLARVGPNGLAWQTRTSDGTPVSLALLSDTPVPTDTLVTVADGLRPVAIRTPPDYRPGNR